MTRSGKTKQGKTSSIGKLKQSFNDGVADGRRAFLKKLLTVKGIEVQEIQRLYSSGLMEPDILEDITLGDLVNLSGIKVDLARKIKEIVLRDDTALPPEYEKQEVEKIKKEKEGILAEIERVKEDIEKIDKEHHLLKITMKAGLRERDNLRQELEEFKEKEKVGYFREKRLQDEVMFVIKEQNMFQEEVDRHARELEQSKRELEAARREFLFTKGESEYLLEKINYLMTKLDTAVQVKGASSNKLTSFLNELKLIHDRLENTYRNGKLTYYANKSDPHF